MITKAIFYTIFILSTFSISSYAQQKVIDLWSSSIPYSIDQQEHQEQIEYDDKGNPQRISQVTNPTLTIFDEVESNQSPCIIICPGGGYKHLSINKEGYKVAKWLNSMGIKAFVLKYRLPSKQISTKPELAPLHDLTQAIELVKQNTKKWKVDKDKIGIMGFSAGGHLAATGADLADYSILIYPVISMDTMITHMGSRSQLLGPQPSIELVNQFSADTNISNDAPPTFIIHSQDDKSVPVDNSLSYYKALCDRDIKAEIHIYPSGGHGFGMGRDGNTHPWVASLQLWLTNITSK